MTNDGSTSAGESRENAPAHPDRKPRGVFASLWHEGRLLFGILYQQIDADRTFSQASALTYKTLFSLLPVFVLSLLVLSLISTGGGKNALDREVKRMIFDQFSLNKIPVTDDQGQAMTQPSNGHTRTVMASDIVEPVIDRAENAVTSRASGIIAFGILLYGAITLMIVIEETFNLIYGAMKPRRWVRRLMLYWCVLTIGPIGVAATVALGNATYVKAADYVGAGAAWWLPRPMQVLSGVAVSFVLLTLLFKLIPHTYVKWKSAIIGGLFAAVLWEVCKWGFGIYVQQALHSSWYGSLALIPFFMLWIYVIWCAILLGLHVAYMHQYFTVLKRRFLFMQSGANVLGDIRWVLPLGVFIYRRFKEGKETSLREAEDHLMLPNDVTGKLFEALEAAGIVRAAHREAYALARPARSITAFDLLAAARKVCEMPCDSSVSEKNAAAAVASTCGEFAAMETDWARKHTLPELAGEPREAQPRRPARRAPDP